jgi:hypothetical protein
VLDDAEAAPWRVKDPWRATERIAVKRYAVVRHVEACVVEQVKGFGTVSEPEPLADVDFFENGRVETRLEWTAEDIAPAISERRLIGITNTARVARGNTVLSWLESWVIKRRLAEDRFAGVYSRSALQLSLCNRVSGGEGEGWVRNVVVEAIEDAGQGD